MTVLSTQLFNVMGQARNHDSVGQVPGDRTSNLIIIFEPFLFCP